MPKSPSDSETGPVARFLDRLEGNLDRHRLTAPGDRVLVAVSGGPDSIALLHGLHRLAPRWRLQLAVVHLHHGLRGDAADQDRRRVIRLARRLSLGCDVRQVDAAAVARQQGESLETAGRRLRYDFFATVARHRACRRIAVGHQRNDNAELVLMNLLRGSGPLGLAGMAPLHGDTVIRPLLSIDRQTILSFLAAIGAEYGEDETNRHLHHRRNWIRHVLLPLLAAETNPSIVDALNRTATIVRDEEAWLAPMVSKQLAEVLRSAGGNALVLDRVALASLAPAARRRVLRAAIGRLRPDLQRIGLAHVEAVDALALRPGPPRRLHLPHRLEVIGDATRLEIRRRSAPLRRPVEDLFYHHVLGGPGRLALPVLKTVAEAAISAAPPTRPGLTAGQWTAFFDMEVVGFPLVVRSVQPGDRFRPLGAGGRQKLAKFFIDHKVPRHLRRRFPVVESRGQIIWLAGQRIAAAVEAPVTASMTLAVTFRPAAGAAAAPPHPRKESAE